MKLNTVNVIEMTHGNLQGLTAYPETPEGNKAAEEQFTACLKENTTLDGEEIEAAIEDGHYDNNGYELFLTHSI